MYETSDGTISSKLMLWTRNEETGSNQMFGSNVLIDLNQVNKLYDLYLPHHFHWEEKVIAVVHSPRTKNQNLSPWVAINWFCDLVIITPNLWAHL